MSQAVSSISPGIDFRRVRDQFPVLRQEVYGHPIVYLDNAASSQMPDQVADRMDHYHRYEHANVHRGIHFLSQEATTAYEETRTLTQTFIGAEKSEEIIFTTGTTDSINLVASSYGRLHFREGSEIILSEMEHHANIVPWQLIAEQTGARIRVIPMTDAGDLDLQAYRSLLNERTALVAVTHVSNALGTVNPVEEMTAMAHDAGAVILVDGAQAAPHRPVDVQEIGCDFYVFSSHKMCGPTGFGILYGKEEWLSGMPPYRGGGDMIDRVTFEQTTYNIPPHRFEAGTPPIAAGIGFGEAIRYLNQIGMEPIAKREEELLAYTESTLAELEGVRILGSPKERASSVSFLVDDIHPQDTGTILDKHGVAIRTGHHCAQPVMDRFGVSATARASVAFYNNESDIDRLADGIRELKTFFKS
ncbi:MAG: cysteine desulfurase [Balneolaceae bacterium]